MNKTWEQLTEAQRSILKSAINAGYVIRDSTWIPFSGFAQLVSADLLFVDDGRYCPTAAGLEVYAQRNAAPSPTEPLAAVWQSTAALYERFGLTPNVQNTTMVFSEETAELLKAALLESPENTALEAADVIVTALGVCMARGVALRDVVAAIRATVAKNDAKTHETHAVNAAGKIARRVE